MKVGELQIILKLATTQFKAGIKSAMGALEQFKTKAAKVGSALKSAFEGALGMVKKFGLVGAAAFTGMVIAHARFEDAIHRTAVIVGKGTALAKEQYEELSAKAREMGRDTLYSSTEAAKGMEQMARAGMSAKDIIGSIREVVNLAIADELELADAAGIVVEAMAQFNMKASDSQKISDVLATAALSAKVRVVDLAEGMKYAGALASDLGTDFETTVAILAKVAHAGIDASSAGAALRTMMARLAEGSEPVNEALGKLGINIRNRRGEMKPFGEIIDEFSRALARAGNKTDAFGQVSEALGMRALPAMLAAVRDGSLSLHELTASLRDAEGNAKRVADEFRTTTTGRWRDLTAAVNELSISLVGAFGDSIKNTIFGLRNWILSLQEALDKNDRLKSILDGIKQGLQPLVGSFKSVGDAIIQWISTIDGQAVGAKFAEIFTSIFNGISTVTKAFEGVDWESALAGALATLRAIVEALATVTKSLQALNNLGGTRAGAAGIGGSLGTAAGSAAPSANVGGAAGVGFSLLGKVKEAIEGFFNKSSEAEQEVAAAITSQGTAMEAMKVAIKTSGEDTKTQIKDAEGNMVTAISGVGSQIESTISVTTNETSKGLIQVGNQVVEGFQDINQALAKMQSQIESQRREVAAVKSAAARSSQKGRA